MSIRGSIHMMKHRIHGLKAVSGDPTGDVELPPDATGRSTKPSVPSVSSVRAFPILRFTPALGLAMSKRQRVEWFLGVCLVILSHLSIVSA